MITLITESDPPVYSVSFGETGYNSIILCCSDIKLLAITEAQAKLRSALAMLIMIENDERQVAK